MSEGLQGKKLDEFEDIEEKRTSKEQKGFDWEKFLFNNRKPLTLLLIGLIFLGFGSFANLCSWKTKTYGSLMILL